MREMLHAARQRPRQVPRLAYFGHVLFHGRPSDRSLSVASAPSETRDTCAGYEHRSGSSKCCAGRGGFVQPLIAPQKAGLRGLRVRKRCLPVRQSLIVCAVVRQGHRLQMGKTMTRSRHTRNLVFLWKICGGEGFSCLTADIPGSRLRKPHHNAWGLLRGEPRARAVVCGSRIEKPIQIRLPDLHFRVARRFNSQAFIPSY